MISRLIRALANSWDGLRAAVAHERAFRQELFVIIPLSLGAFWIPVPLVHRALLIGSLLVILIVELLNSAIEANTDHISTALHPLAKRAKDMASAAVLLALILAATVWGCVLWRFV